MSKHWDDHPGVPTGGELTFGERAADMLRSGMGSWMFIVLFSLGMALWAWTDGPEGIDPFPYVFGNLFLSMLAALQGAIILVAAKRQDQIASQVANHTLENTTEHRELLQRNTELTQQIHDRLHGDGL